MLRWTTITQSRPSRSNERRQLQRTTSRIVPQGTGESAYSATNATRPTTRLSSLYHFIANFWCAHVLAGVTHLRPIMSRTTNLTYQSRHQPNHGYAPKHVPHPATSPPARQPGPHASSTSNGTTGKQTDIDNDTCN